MHVPYRDEEVKPADPTAATRWLAAYSMAAAGGAMASTADAAVIPINLPGGGPIVVETPDPGIVTESFDLDMDGDGVRDFRLQSYLGAIIRSDYLGPNGVVLDYQSPNVRFLGAGELIDDDLLVDNGFDVLEYRGTLDNFIGTRGFAGVRFDIPGGSPHFGYLDVEVAPNGYTLTLYGGAYESESGVGILAGAVPEPTGLGLLAMGAAGVAARRREA